jgi:hypothetical protein
MQTPLIVRAILASGSGAAGATPRTDVSDFRELVLRLIVHAISGTTPSLQVQLQTSDDEETWSNVGSALSLSSVGTTATALVCTASGQEFGRWIRASITLTGTNATTNLGVYLNGHA